MWNQAPKLTSILITLLVMFGYSRESSAVCAGLDKRFLVAQPNDLVFTEGIPETKLIPAVYAHPAGENLDCGVQATSSIFGVLVEQTYACGVLCAVSQSEEVDIAGGPGAAYRFPLVLPSFPGEITPLEGAVPIHYDGTARAGSIGFIAFEQRTSDEVNTDPVFLGSVNVYVVPQGQQPETWFRVAASSSNIVGDMLIIDHPFLNNNANANVFVQHFRTSDGLFWDHPVAAIFVGQRWRVRNEDATPMPIGLTFNVRVDPSAFKIRTKYQSEGIQESFLIVNHPLANGNPFATIIATPISAGTSQGTRRFMDRPYAVLYDGAQWQVKFVDGSPMPPSISVSPPGLSRRPPIEPPGQPPVPPLSPQRFEPGFVVKVIATSEFVDDSLTTDPSGFAETQLSNGGVDIVAINRTSGASKIINFFCWSTNTFSPFLATMNLTPLPPPAPINYNWLESKFIGVGLLGDMFQVFHEDASTMLGETPFNIWAPFKDECPPGPPSQMRYRPPTGPTSP